VARHTTAQHAVGLRKTQNPMAIQDFLARKRLAGVFLEVLQGLLLKIIERALGHTPRKWLITVKAYLSSPVDLGKEVTQIDREGGRQRQCVVPQLVVVGDGHAALHSAWHQFLGVKVSKLCDRIGVGLSTFGSILLHHGFAGLVGINHQPKTHDHEHGAQPLHGPAQQHLTQPVDQSLKSTHFVSQLQSA